MLEVKNLTIQTRAGQTLVDSIRFSVEDGECLGLIGESGSGKSMTSKAIMGLLNPKAFQITGSVCWNGQELLGKPDVCYRGKDICMIPQNPMTAFAPMVKIGTQMEMSFAPKTRADKQMLRRELEQALVCVNLYDTDKIMNSYPGELSGGMLQRVMIALTMVQSPKLIIADEITTAIDAASEYRVLEHLELLHHQGIALLVITHDFGVASRLCSRIAVMKDGRLIEQGTVHDVFHHPVQACTKQLIDASILFREGAPC